MHAIDSDDVNNTTEILSRDDVVVRRPSFAAITTAQNLVRCGSIVASGDVSSPIDAASERFVVDVDVNVQPPSEVCQASAK